MENRNILFRGKSIDNGAWIYGDLVQWRSNKLYFILPQFGGKYHNSNDFIQIDPDTIGQYSGAQDKNLNSIFEGDLVIDEGSNIGEIVWNKDDCSFSVNWNGGLLEPLYETDSSFFEIVRTVHEDKKKMV